MAFQRLPTQHVPLAEIIYYYVIIINHGSIII